MDEFIQNLKSKNKYSKSYEKLKENKTVRKNSSGKENKKRLFGKRAPFKSLSFIGNKLLNKYP